MNTRPEPTDWATGIQIICTVRGFSGFEPYHCLPCRSLTQGQLAKASNISELGRDKRYDKLYLARNKSSSDATSITEEISGAVDDSRS